MVANDIPVEKKSRQLGNLAKAIEQHKLSIVDEHLHFFLQYCHIHLHLFCTCMSYGALACHMHLLHVFCTDLRLETFCQSVVRQGLRLGNRAELGFISSSCRVSQKIAYGTLRARLGTSYFGPFRPFGPIWVILAQKIGFPRKLSKRCQQLLLEQLVVSF